MNEQDYTEAAALSWLETEAAIESAKNLPPAATLINEMLAEKDAIIERHERTIERLSGEWADLMLARDELEQEAKELRANAALALGTQRADNERMIAAAERADVLYAGCDTPEMLADEVVMLRAELSRALAWMRAETGKEPGQGWISVDDALPDESLWSDDGDKPLLVVCKCGEGTVTDTALYYGEDGWWFRDIEFGLLGVTHWREMQEPPQAEKPQ